MPQLAANLSMLFTELDFLDRFEAAARAGFRGVEYLFPYDFPMEQLRDRLEQNQLTQVLHNLPAGDWQAGERGIACDPSRVGEFQEGVGQAIAYAKALGCGQVNCLAGIAPNGIDEGTLRETFVSNQTFAANELAKADITLLIEPINTRDIPGFYLCHTQQALECMAAAGASNLKLQYDAYHMQIMEGDLAQTIEGHMDRIGHIQIADNPGRNEPGTGEINYSYLLPLLDRLGYAGWVGCEYRPLAATEDGLGWAAPFLHTRNKDNSRRKT